MKPPGDRPRPRTNRRVPGRRVQSDDLGRTARCFLPPEIEIEAPNPRDARTADPDQLADTARRVRWPAGQLRDAGPRFRAAGGGRGRGLALG